MTPEQWLIDETRQWLRRGAEDLHAGRHLIEAGLPGPSLFHSQQAAEKLLKAFLTWNQTTFQKTHDLRELGEACAVIDATLREDMEPSYDLSQYAWRFRYPGAPYEPETADARIGLAIAARLESAILRRLPDAARP